MYDARKVHEAEQAAKKREQDKATMHGISGLPYYGEEQIIYNIHKNNRDGMERIAKRGNNYENKNVNSYKGKNNFLGLVIALVIFMVLIKLLSASLP